MNTNSNVNGYEVGNIPIKFEIKEELGVLSESAKGWTKEVNLVSWNEATPKYDIRDWAPNHEKWEKGLL